MSTKRNKNLLYSLFPIPNHEQILNSINFSNRYTLEKALKYTYLSVVFFPSKFFSSIKLIKLYLSEARKKVVDAL